MRPGPGPGPGPRGPRPLMDDAKKPRPKSIKELPAFLLSQFGGFFHRFFYILKLVWRTGRWIPFLLFFVALFRGVSPVIGSLISQNILNKLQDVIRLGGLPESEFLSSGILQLLIALFVYRLLILVINNISSALNRIAGEKIVNEVKSQIMEKSKEVDLSSYDNPAFYEKMENANQEAGHRPLSVLTETFGIISYIIEFVSFLIILFSAPGLAWLTLLVLVVSIPSAVTNFIFRRKNFGYMRWRSKERRQMHYFSNILVDKDLMKEIRLFDLADTFISRYKKVFQQYFKGLQKLIFQENAWHILFAVASGVCNLFFYIVIAKQVFTGEIQIGDYTLYTGAIASVATCVSSLISASGNVYQGTLFIDNLISFMNEKQRIAPLTTPGKLVEHGHNHTIEFKNVSFRYPGTNRDVIKNVSFTIEPGQTLALVGLNGAGKTTLIKLMTRLYDTTEGQILLDGVDIKEYELKSLYRTFGIIFQDFGRYAATVEENIRFGNVHSDAPMDAVKHAAKQSTSNEYIESLPNGYNTPLMRFFEHTGTELSIGQWQKIAIARAFYADSDIMILDEPTASLDAIAEQNVFNQFDQLTHDKTTIFVSHRLSSATIADQIIVLENGVLIEKGNHQELMDMHGKYYDLFTTQSKRYIQSKAEEPVI